MKFTFFLFLLSCPIIALSQLQKDDFVPEYHGQIKSVSIVDYTYEKSDTSANKKDVHPTCEVCDHFQKFDASGKLIEKQEYIIAEPVSDLEMGYCLNMTFEYDGDDLVLITSTIFEEHGMSSWDDSFKNGMKQTMYSATKKGAITTTKYTDEWGETSIKQYKEGRLIRDDERLYSYDDQGRKIQSNSVEGDSITIANTETWTYEDGLLVKTASIRDGSYFSGYETFYKYYASGQLLSEIKYKLNGREKSDGSELYTANYYYEDGRDSLHQFVNLYSREKTKRDFIFEYEFHPNGKVSTKTQKNVFGQICGFDSFDEKGNLTQHDLYNIHFEAYNIDKYTYNENNQVVEKRVIDNYDEKEYSILYKYDLQGNETHSYLKSDKEFRLIQHKTYEYYR